MDVTAAVPVVVGVVAPTAIAIINRVGWSPSRKRAVAVAVEGLLGLLVAVALGLIHGIPASIVSAAGWTLVSVATVVVTAQASHQAFRGALDTLERATDSHPRRAIEEPAP